VTISVDAVVFFNIENPIDSVSNIENVRHSTQLLAQTTLRNILGTKTLAEVLADREQIKSYMQVRRFKA
jgi:erythrocyte band 7 integral membrane protein